MVMISNDTCDLYILFNVVLDIKLKFNSDKRETTVSIEETVLKEGMGSKGYNRK